MGNKKIVEKCLKEMKRGQAKIEKIYEERNFVNKKVTSEIYMNVNFFFEVRKGKKQKALAKQQR